MDAQVETMTQPKAQSIVEQLLEIAKKYDAMDVIAGSTSWRWQEGFITRMPKIKTVATVLKKAFKSDDPKVWIDNTDRELQKYLIINFSTLEEENIYTNRFTDKFELLFYFSVSDSRGSSYDELVFKLALFKYAEVFNKDVIYFEDLNESDVLTINGEWAELKIKEYIKKFSVNSNKEGFYQLGQGDNLIIDEESTKFIKELEILRLRIVGYNSHFDMWQNYTIALTDREMIYFERKMKNYFKSIREELRSNSLLQEKIKDETTRKTRVFSLSTFSIPNCPGEELTCKY